MAYQTTTPLMIGGKRYPTGSIVELTPEVAARSLDRGDVIEVSAPTKSQPDPPPPDPETTGLIDLNTATATELTSIPGIGKASAEKIIEHRPIILWADLADLLPNLDIEATQAHAEIR